MLKYAHVIAEVLSNPWAILDSKFDAIVAVLARREAGERFTEEEIRSVVGERKTVAAALPYVVDEQGQVFRGVREADGAGNVVEMSAYTAAAAGGAKGKLVAILPMYGMILPRAADFNMSEQGSSIEAMRKNFRSALSNPDVKAIVLDVDSPGGSVYQVDEFAKEIFDARGQKKIVAQINPLAASAAYYLASQADEIAITPSGEVGSIGVRAMHQDLSKALELKGVKVTTITFGKYKAENNPFEPMSDEGKAFMQQRVNDYGAMFEKAVARGRGVSVGDVGKNFGEGRVFGASEGKSRGMVDKIATLEQTLQRLGGGSASAQVPMGSSAAVTPIAAHSAGGNVGEHEIAVIACGDSAKYLANNPQLIRALESALRANKVSGSEVAAGADVNPAIAETETTEVDSMETQTTATAVAGTEAVQAANLRAATIVALASMHGMSDKAAGWLKENKSVEAVQAEILGTLASRATPVQTSAQPGAQIQLTDKEQQHYSILRGVRALCARAGRGFGQDSNCLEFEISDTIAKKLGRETSGFLMPTNIRTAATPRFSDAARGQYEAVLQGATGQAPGSNLVQTTVLPSEFIQLLRNMQVLTRLGVRKLGDLQGNLQLPKQTGAATLSWTGENPGSAVTASDQTFGNVAMSPKTAMAQTLYSRQFLIQSSLDAEQLVREDLAAIFALGLDLAGLYGTGASNQPTGIANTSGINVVAIGTNGGAITYNLIVDCQTALETNNVPIVSPGIATTPGVKGKLRKTAKLANTIAGAIWDDDNTVAGYPAIASNQLPSNLTKGSGVNLHALIAGDFAQALFAEWGAMEIIADPYTQAGKNNVVLTANMLVDFAVRYAAAFSIIKDIDPTL
jgi:HK97 family phage major capsid protein